MIKFGFCNDLGCDSLQAILKENQIWHVLGVVLFSNAERLLMRKTGYD